MPLQSSQPISAAMIPPTRPPMSTPAPAPRIAPLIRPEMPAATAVITTTVTALLVWLRSRSTSSYKAMSRRDARIICSDRAIILSFWRRPAERPSAYHKHTVPAAPLQSPPDAPSGPSRRAAAHRGGLRANSHRWARTDPGALLLAHPNEQGRRRGHVPARGLHRAALSLPPLGGRGARGRAVADVEPIPVGGAPFARGHPVRPALPGRCVLRALVRG